MKQIGNYQLDDSLGRGSFAEVFKAVHLPSGKLVAVKLYKASVKQVEKQFLGEARIASALKHPHIIEVHDFGIEEDTPYLVMSYASKGSLDHFHPTGAKLPLPIIVSYMKQIADALQYAHDHKVIHRDIKPANILVGQDGQLLVTDFGIAEIAHSTLSFEEQQIAGTSVYMAPEQIEGRAERASDQYALGIMVYEWLCGEAPFKGPVNILLHQHQHVPPPPLHEKISISSAVEEVVLKALAKRPEQRYATIADFARALEQASIQELGILLSTPERAAKLLTQQYVQDMLFEHLMRDRNWWSSLGRIMIHRLSSQASQEGRRNIIALLSTLAERSVRELGTAIQQEDEISVVNLLDLLYWTAPPSTEPDVWIRLLKDLSTHPQAVAFIMNKWYIYAGLMQQWGIASISVENEQLRQWFPRTWAGLWQFLALPLPAEWYDVAVTNLLDSTSTAPLPASMVRTVEQEHTTTLYHYLDSPFRSFQQQRAVIGLFAKLIESGYAKKMDLLNIMLVSSVGSKDQRNYVESVLVAAQLTQVEIRIFLERYGESIQSYYRLPIVLKYAEQYLSTLTPNDLSRPAPKPLLEFLCKNPFLPSELQASACNWSTIAGFIDKPMSNAQELGALARALSQLQPPLRSALIERLIEPFTICIKSDIDLMNMIFAMKTNFAESELLDLLYRLAMNIGEAYRSNRSETSLVPYILIALQIEKIVRQIPFNEQQEFVRQFLRTLLRYTDGRAYKRLDAIARNWHPELYSRWQQYLKKYKDSP